jgi:hypothetical protein
MGNPSNTLNIPGSIFNISIGSLPTSYTPYSYSFNATGSSATLTFAGIGDAGGPAHNYFLLDSISVNHTSANTNVLINGGFETGDLTGWTMFCNTSSNCNGTYYGQVITSQYYQGTHCYMDDCRNYDYLTQSFSTVSGDSYLISFYIKPNTVPAPQVIYVTLT